MTDQERKMASITGLALNFGKEMPKELLKLWLKGVEPFTPDEVAWAVMRVIENYEYKTIPPFAVFRKYLPNSPKALPDPAETKALKAEAEWQHLLDDIHHYGIYNEPTMMHPVTEYVLRGLGGWRAACSWMEDELHWRKEEFIAGWIRTDGVDLAMLEGGARAIEQRQAQIALGNGDDRTLKRITRSVVRRLEA